jgi:hypothetical protein
LQVFDFVHAEFSILMIFRFFLMTTECAEIFISNFPLSVLSASAVNYPEPS